ncbi:MAG: cytochrome c oxidase assembly protein [Acidobacteria bacterium]|nr:cytochrome c oxidase assembly protein [Acidobacteriota bacterium]
MTTVLGLAAAVGAVTTAGGAALLVTRAAVLVVLVLSVAAVLGILVLVAFGVSADDGRRGRLLDLAAGAAALWAVASAVTAVLLYLGEAPSGSSAAFGPGLVSFVLDVETGRSWLIGAVAAALLSAVLVAVRSARGVAVLLMLSAAAVIPVALQSPAPGDSIAAQRTVIAAGLVQLLALGAWTGELATAQAIGAPIRRGSALACFLAVLVAVGAALPVLAADGAASPMAMVGAAAVGVAGVLGVLGGGRRLPAFRGAQLVLLAVGTGLGAAAAVTRGVPPVPARSTPAAILTGEPLPPRPGLFALLGAWQPDPLWLVVCVALLAGYALIARTSPGWPALRSCSWVVGVLLLAWLTNGAPAVYQEVLFGAHLMEHVALLLVVPLLLAGGAPRRLLASSRTGSGSAAGGMSALLDSRALRAVARPAPAAAVATVALIALYGSGVLRWTVDGAVGAEASSAACLAVGAVLVQALIEPSVSGRRTIGVAAVLLAVESGGAVALAVGSSLLLPDWFGAMGWGTDALAAQRGAALGSWILAAVPTLLLLLRALRTSRTAGSSLARPGTASA